MMVMSSFQGFHQVTNFANAEKVLTDRHIKLCHLSNLSKSAILSALTPIAHKAKLRVNSAAPLPYLLLGHCFVITSWPFVDHLYFLLSDYFGTISGLLDLQFQTNVGP